MSDFDKMLERVARRVCLATTGKAEAGDLAAVQFVLREMVLPLLEAGQAMRDCMEGMLSRHGVLISWEPRESAF